MDAFLRKKELKDEFEGAAREAIDEADYLTKAEAEEAVADRMAEHGLDEPEEEESPDSIRDETADIADRMEDEGVPDDLIDAVMEYLTANDVADAIGAEQVDKHLAAQHEELQSIKNDLEERQEKVREARGRDVDVDQPLLDAAVYHREDV